LFTQFSSLGSFISDVLKAHQMPIRPFPYPLAIGTDIVHVARVRAILQRAEGNPERLDRFLQRFLLPPERDDFYKNRERLIERQLDVNSKHLAGRYVHQ
jgi:holo-[acyl-carrier protein] synthase